MSGAISPTVPADLRQGNLGSLRALLAGRTRGTALTALLDARLAPESQFTLLTCAAWWGQADAVRLLLESGASTGPTTRRGSTALYIACQKDQLDCVRLLLGANADADQANEDGVTPLYIACQKGYLECVRLLLGASAAVNQARGDGVTPLYIACQEGQLECAQLLLEAGGAVDQATNDILEYGRTICFPSCPSRSRLRAEQREAHRRRPPRRGCAPGGGGGSGGRLQARGAVRRGAASAEQRNSPH